ncbi:hypothetical protein [Sodalinema gerasimenkoae]|uniref:hypothetical protein n=1 Tax=Sodalinema gerasimenkoae TaxID=2862348 RepID=UPI00135BF29A|nr:hypothetical protein [Sodalinema gerasimenkoae]
MKTHWLTAIIVPAVLGLCWFPTAPLRATPPSTPCSNENPEPPSPERQDVVIPRHDLRFEIPQNYESILEEYPGEEEALWIHIRNPTDVAFLNCAIEHRLIGAGHQVSDVMVKVEPRPGDMQQIDDILTSSPHHRIRDVTPIHIAGEEAITWIELSSTAYAYVTYNAALLHPDGEHLIRIFVGNYGMTIAPQDVQVLEMVMESFAFPRISP